MNTFAIVAGIASIIGVFIALATTHWGRQIITDCTRGMRVPLLGIRMVSIGVYDFFDSRDALTKKQKSTRAIEYLSPATKEIGIIALSLNYSIVHQNLHDEFRKLLKTKPDLKIYLFLLNPKSLILPTIALASGRSAEELKDYIEQSLSRLNKMYAALDSSEQNRFHLRLYDTYVANSVLVVDPYEKKGRILIENYLYKVPIEGRYSIECERQGSPMFEKVRTAYEHFKEDFASVVGIS
ncbi:MAG: hypothetical protein M0017_00675 [Desulfobacteraceae bacterium]|nr:hypothetical protein [Desulfobacteraceae bacterium]